MADPFVAEVRIFPFNFAPKGWAFCNGQLLPLSQNTALFALLGTIYGGDGKSTFALPNLQGRAPMQPGQGQGLSLRDLGESDGVEAVTLLVSEIPVHTHTMVASAQPALSNNPMGNLPARATLYTDQTSAQVQMAPNALSPAGGSLPHNNMMPYLTVNFCIAMQGVFPPRP
jgi:microcystin-dependent protein